MGAILDHKCARPAFSMQEIAKKKTDHPESNLQPNSVRELSMNNDMSIQSVRPESGSNFEPFTSLLSGSKSICLISRTHTTRKLINATKS